MCETEQNRQKADLYPRPSQRSDWFITVGQKCFLALNHQFFINQQEYFKITSLTDRKPVWRSENWNDAISCLGLAEDSSSSVLNHLSDWFFFVETFKDTVTVVQSTEDKLMDKIFQILLRQISPGVKRFNSSYMLQVVVGWLCLKYGCWNLGLSPWLNQGVCTLYYNLFLICTVPLFVHAGFYNFNTGFYLKMFGTFCHMAVCLHTFSIYIILFFATSSISLTITLHLVTP